MAWMQGRWIFRGMWHRSCGILTARRVAKQAWRRVLQRNPRSSVSWMSLYLEENKNNINTVTKEGEGTHIRGYHALLTEINKNTKNSFSDLWVSQE